MINKISIEKSWAKALRQDGKNPSGNLSKRSDEQCDRRWPIEIHFSTFLSYSMSKVSEIQ